MKPRVSWRWHPHLRAWRVTFGPNTGWVTQPGSDEVVGRIFSLATLAAVRFSGPQLDLDSSVFPGKVFEVRGL